MHKITLIPGDGIGREISEAAKLVIKATGVKINWDIADAGAECIESKGSPLPDDVLNSVRKNRVALKGPITTPIGTGFRSVNVSLRKQLNLFKLIEKYNIDEANQLEEIILAKVNGEANEYSEYEERLEHKKGIMSKREFDNMILDYRLKYDDDKVFKIPWDRYFLFEDVDEKAKIDGAYITTELISMIFEIPIESVREDWLREKEVGENKMTLTDYLAENSGGEVINTKLFSQKALNYMHCEERYSYHDRFYSFSFDYSNERSANFEFNGEN